LDRPHHDLLGDRLGCIRLYSIDSWRNWNLGKNPNDPNMLTIGAYGNAFELMLQTTTDGDGTTSDSLIYKSYGGQTNGTFSATEDTGSGSDLKSAYQTLLVSMQANGELDDATSSRLQDAIGKLGTESQSGTTDATISGGGMLAQAGGSVNFNQISAYQNQFVDSLINGLSSQLQVDS
jgi:hypothetical protein